MAVAIDLKDAYNTVHLTLFMGLLTQYGVSLTLTQWSAGALLERTVVIELGNCSSAPHWLKMAIHTPVTDYKDHRSYRSSTMYSPRTWYI